MPTRSQRPCPLPALRREPLHSNHSVRPRYIEPRRPIRKTAKPQMHWLPGPSFLPLWYWPILSGKCQPAQRPLRIIPITRTRTRHNCNYGGAKQHHSGCQRYRRCANKIANKVYMTSSSAEAIDGRSVALWPMFQRECAFFTTDFCRFFWVRSRTARKIAQLFRTDCAITPFKSRDARLTANLLHFIGQTQSAIHCGFIKARILITAPVTRWSCSCTCCIACCSLA
jgi:hypothetical protein